MPLLNMVLPNVDEASDAVAVATIELEEKVAALGIDRNAAAVLVASFLRGVLQESEPEDALAIGLAAVRRYHGASERVTSH